MKKKGGKRGITRTKRVVKKENNILLYILVILILAIVLLLAIQNPLTGNTITGRQVEQSASAQVFIDPLVDLVDGWTQGRIAETSAKFLFLILVILFIWSILDQVHLFGGGKAQLFIAIIVGFLSTVYIAPQDVWVILVGYNALGATLLTLIPFAILALYTFRVVEDNDAKKVTLQKVIWGMFTLFLVYFYINGWIQNKITGFSGLGIAYLIATLSAALVFFFNSALVSQLAKMHVEAMKVTAEANMKKMEIGMDTLRQTGEKAAGETPKPSGI